MRTGLFTLILVGGKAWPALFGSGSAVVESACLSSGGSLSTEHTSTGICDPCKVLVGENRRAVSFNKDDLVVLALSVLSDPVGVSNFHVRVAGCGALFCD